MSTFAHLNDRVWSEIAPELKPGEFKEPEQMDTDFLRRLSKMRRAAKAPFRIVSDARDPEGSVGASVSAHKERPCKAVDLRVLNNAERFLLVREALAGEAMAVLREIVASGVLTGPILARAAAAAKSPGLARVGIYPPTAHQVATFGKGSGSVHLDASTVNPQDRIWMSY
jgi:hypothetical protein